MNPNRQAQPIESDKKIKFDKMEPIEAATNIY